MICVNYLKKKINKDFRGINNRFIEEKHLEQSLKDEISKNINKKD